MSTSEWSTWPGDAPRRAPVPSEADPGTGERVLATCDLDHGWDDNPARVYGHFGSPRTCIRIKATDEWVFDPEWETTS